LRIGRRYRFNPAAVNKVLVDLAAGNRDHRRATLLTGQGVHDVP